MKRLIFSLYNGGYGMVKNLKQCVRGGGVKLVNNEYRVAS